MTLDVYERQVPLQPMFDYVDSPSTTTTIACQDRLHGDATSTSLDDPGRLQKRVPLPSTLEDPVDPEHPRDMNNYFHYEMYHYRRQDREYLYRRRERLLPRRPRTTTSTTAAARTTTSTTSRERLLPLHRSEIEPLQKRTLQRYNRRDDDPWTNACYLR